MTDGGNPFENPAVQALKRELGDKVVEISSPRIKRIEMRGTPETYRDIIKYLQEKQGWC